MVDNIYISRVQHRGENVLLAISIETKDRAISGPDLELVPTNTPYYVRGVLD